MHSQLYDDRKGLDNHDVQCICEIFTPMQSPLDMITPINEKPKPKNGGDPIKVEIIDEGLLQKNQFIKSQICLNLNILTCISITVIGSTIYSGAFEYQAGSSSY